MFFDLNLLMFRQLFCFIWSHRHMLTINWIVMLIRSKGAHILRNEMKSIKNIHPDIRIGKQYKMPIYIKIASMMNGKCLFNNKYYQLSLYVAFCCFRIYDEVDWLRKENILFLLQNNNNHRNAVAYQGAILRTELILGKSFQFGKLRRYNRHKPETRKQEKFRTLLP